MQHPPATKPGPAADPRLTRRGALAALALAPLAGCGGPEPPPPPPPKPHDGVRLAVRCPDAAFAAALDPLARAWAYRTGATVEVAAGPPTPADAADLGVLAPAELGTWAEAGELVPVPSALRATDSPFQWLGLLGVYRERLAAWGGEVFALPLAGDGHVVVYRADRFADRRAAEAFAAKFKRPPAAPAAWEDFADAAEFFRDLDGRPSLPPADDAKLADLFFRAAACHDRPALTDIALAKQRAGAGGATASLAFAFHLDTARPRLDAPGFQAAAGWLARLKGCLPADGPADPAAALADGRAVLGVLTLAELARLPRENGAVPPRFGIAALPGTRSYTDPGSGKPVPVPPPATNYVPYFAGGRLGVVRKRCPHPAAAFELLAELGGPVRSLELVAAAGLGAGPFRASHLDRDRLPAWLGYGFDPDRSRALQDALRAEAGLSVANPVFGLRGPDQAALTAALAAELRQVVAGSVPPGEALNRAAAAWEKLDAATPRDRLVQLRRRDAGLQ